MIAALYIDPRGPYPKMDEVECWDEARDAKLYDGPWPVVAHPPCGPWGALRHMRVPNRERRVHDAECGPRAVEQVRRWGGVLEQPAGSKLWEACRVPVPWTGDACGFSVEVPQVAFGHVARKRTWLYICGLAPGAVLDRAFAAYRDQTQPTHWVSGGRVLNRKGSGGIVPPGIKVCSAQQRRRTPQAFAEWLVSIARSVRA